MLRTEEHLNKANSLDVSKASDEFYDQSVLAFHHEGGGTWGHYLVQSLPKALLFLERFPYGKIAVPDFHVFGTSNFSKLLSLFGITKDKLLPIKKGVVYKFREIVLVDFLFDFKNTIAHPAALTLLKRVLARKIKMGSEMGKNITFITRGKEFRRRIMNQEEAISALAAKGITHLNLGSLDLSDQIACWDKSDAIIATLGSDFANIVFGKPDTKLLAVSPHWFGDNFFFELAIANNMQWNEIRCGVMGEPKTPLHASDFTINTQMLESAIENSFGTR